MTKNNESGGVSYITTRDASLLKAIIPGACTFQYLLERQILFPSESALRQRLAQLIKGEYIQSQLYDNPTDGTKYALYCLDSAGVAYLTENGYSADEIRILLPSQHTVAHELTVTDIVRRLRTESGQIPYKLRYHDDPSCRSGRKLLGLNAPVPDLLVEIILPAEYDVYRFNIEVHMGSVPVLSVVDKALKQEWQTLYICPTKEKKDELWKAMVEHSKSKLQGMVYFTIIYEFCEKSGGVFGSNYMALDGRSVSLYP